MKKLLTLFALIILITALVVTQAEEQMYKLNDPATTSKGVKITMLSVKESKGSYYWGPEDGKIFVIAEFLIENNSKDELSISTMLNWDAYVDDFAIDYSFSAIVACDNQLDVTVKAGRKVQGQMGFEVNKNWRVIEIEYKPEWLGRETITFVYDKYGSNINTDSDGMGVVYVQPGTNARTMPSADSAIAAFLQDGGNYNYYEINSGWYYIKLDEGVFGYVFSSRCRVIS